MGRGCVRASGALSFVQPIIQNIIYTANELLLHNNPSTRLATMLEQQLLACLAPSTASQLSTEDIVLV